MFINKHGAGFLNLSPVMFKPDGGEGGGSGEGAAQAAVAAPAAPSTAVPPATYTPPASQEEYDRSVQDRLARQQKQYGMTPEEAKALKDSHDKLQFDLSSATEQAVTTAKTEAAADVAGVFMPQLVNANLDAAAARAGIGSEELSKAIEFLDHEKFLDANGTAIDPSKVSAFIDGIKPAAAGSGRGAPAFVRPLGQGSQQQVGVKPGDSGRAMAAKRFGAKTS